MVDRRSSETTTELARHDTDVERSVQLIVAGGLALVAGLWIEHLAARQSPLWLLGVAVAAAGVLALAVGIARDLTVGPLDSI